MTTRRNIIGVLGAQALGGWYGTALAAKSKDPCKGKLAPAGQFLSPRPTPGLGLGVAGIHLHAIDAIAAVHRDFQALIEFNLRTMPKTAVQPFIAGLHDNELDSLGRLYGRATQNSARPATLLEILAPALDAQQAQRLMRTHSFENVYAAMLRAAPANAHFAVDALQRSSAMHTAKPRASTDLKFNENPLDYTIKEIYLSYRTAPKGSYSVPAAMYETANFTALRLAGSFGIGYSVGTAIQQTWQAVSPSSWDRFSNFIGSTIDSFVRSSASIMGMTPYASLSEPMHVQIGTLQQNLWGSFQDAGPRDWYTGGGDFGVTASWQYKERGGGDCR